MRVKQTMKQPDFKAQVIENAIFTIGTVTSIKGNKVTVKVNKNKNLPYLFYKGETIKNAAAGLSNYVKINKGFIRIICKVEEDYTEEDRFVKNKDYKSESEKINRYLTLNAFGYYESNDEFVSGVKEMPMIGSECKLLSYDEFYQLHQLAKEDEIKIPIGSLSDQETMEINLSVQKLFAGHMGIFGNTGSGKSNTLAKLYTELFSNKKINFEGKSKFIFIDFNGEYSGKKTLTENKTVYKLSAKDDEGDKIPFKKDYFLDIEMLSILVNATDKTQKPFLNRVIKSYKKVHDGEDPQYYFKNILKLNALKILKTSRKESQAEYIDWYREILPDEKFKAPYMHGDIKLDKKRIAEMSDDELKQTDFYQAANGYEFPESVIDKFIHFMYLQLLKDILSDKTYKDFIMPVVLRLKDMKKDFDKIFDFKKKNQDTDTPEKNIIIYDFRNYDNVTIKKTVPLLILKEMYEKQKDNEKTSLHIIIDEAHNILSSSSTREAETWKDYRLETFEEIIKEGRKFGVFMTISSQRPNDISSTITSQLHNYIIHRLVNNDDLKTIERFVSYLDKLSVGTIPNLSTGTCFIAGQMSQFPLSVKVQVLDKDLQPKSETIDLEGLWKKH